MLIKWSSSSRLISCRFLRIAHICSVLDKTKSFSARRRAGIPLFELLQMSICEISFRPLLGLPYCPGFLTLENQVEDPLEDFFREACDRGRWICHLCCFRCYTPLHLCSFLRLLTFPRFRLMEAVADGIERRKNIESMLMDNLCW